MFLNLKILVFHDFQKTSVKNLSYKDHIKDSDHDSGQCAECIAYAKHEVRYTQAHIEYQKPIPEEVGCFTAYMHGVIVLRKFPTKEHSIVSHLVTFNETFAAKTPSKPDDCILWHEAITGLKAPDFVSAFLQLIRQCNEDHIWLWTDNWSGQNKNWYLVFVTGLAQCVNTWGPETISVPREGSHIRGSRCNTRKHLKTISQKKHCRYF